MFSAPCLCPAFRSFSLPLLSLRAVQTPYPAQNAGGPRNDFLTKRAAWLIFQLLGRRTQDHRLRRQQSGLREPTPVIVDTAAIAPDALTIRARALTSVTSTVEKSAMTQPPQQPPTQVFAQKRRSGCGTLLVALLVLAIITAIVIFLGAFGLLGWIFS